MKHISILVLEDATMTSIDGAYQLFRRINDFLKYQGRELFYEIERVGAVRDIAVNNGKYTIQADQLLQEVNRTDAFRLVFKKYTGLSPVNYRNKYR